MKGTIKPMQANSVTTVVARKIKPKVRRRWGMPTMSIPISAPSRDSTPTAKPRACGRGPLKSTDNQAMIDDSKTMAEIRYKRDTRLASIATGTGILLAIITTDLSSGPLSGYVDRPGFLRYADEPEKQVQDAPHPNGSSPKIWCHALLLVISMFTVLRYNRTRRTKPTTFSYNNKVT